MCFINISFKIFKKLDPNEKAYLYIWLGFNFLKNGRYESSA